VAYWLELDEVSVAPYLEALNLSPAGRDRLEEVLQREIAECADTYIQNPERRLAPGSEWFRVDVVFRDPQHADFYDLHFIISDAAAAHGVLRIGFVENRSVSRPELS